MSDPTPPPSAPSTHKPETTFRAFTPAQGANYSQVRQDYHPSLYQSIIDRHVSTGGQLETLIDLGCGPGTAVRVLAPQFTHATGFDPSLGMITTAQSLGGVTKTGEKISFEVSSAEEMEGIPDESVDLIIAATAAHWFDMSLFWPRAGQVLKPGGSVAFWSSSSMKVHPDMPNALKIQEAIDEHEELLKDYMVEGNLLTRDLYRNLKMPWDLEDKEGVERFDEKDFWRKEWGTEGAEGKDDEFFKVGMRPLGMREVEMMLGTTSPVQRWREKNKELVGTEEDVVRAIMKRIEGLLEEAGVVKGEEKLRGKMQGVLLVVKKRGGVV